MSGFRRWPERTGQDKRDRTRVRDRAKRGGRGYDGITDELIYRRDKWVCLMPDCLCPDGRLIDRALLGIQDPWAPSVDHAVPLSEGGLDNARNKRAAHARCNHEANAGRQRDPAWREFQQERSRQLYGAVPDPRCPPPLTRTVADALAGSAALEALRAALPADDDSAADDETEAEAS